MTPGEPSRFARDVRTLATAVIIAERRTRADTGRKRERGGGVIVNFTRPRTECALVSLSKRKQFPHRAWFLARACLRVQEEGYQAPDRINNQQSRCFADLMDRKWLRV